MNFGTTHQAKERVGKDLPWTPAEIASALQSMTRFMIRSLILVMGAPPEQNPFAPQIEYALHR